MSVLGSAGGDCCITRRELPAVTKVVSHYRTYLDGDELRMKPTMLHFFGCVEELHPWQKQPMAKTLIDIRIDHATILYQCRRTAPKAQVNGVIKFYHSSNSPLTINLGVGVVMLTDRIITMPLNR